MRLEWRIALLDVPGDVFDHHDRIVYDKTRGNGEGHQREVVALNPIRYMSPNVPTRERNGRRRNDCRGKSSEKRKITRIMEGDGQHQFELHVPNRRPD